jgi:L-lysine 2,3-aminomutase
MPGVKVKVEQREVLTAAVKEADELLVTLRGQLFSMSVLAYVRHQSDAAHDIRAALGCVEQARNVLRKLAGEGEEKPEGARPGGVDVQ